MSTSNLLLEPIPELTAALRNNAWGIKPESTIIVTECFPVTPEDLESVRDEAKQRGGSSSRVKGKARIVTLEGDSLTVVLGQGGFTIESDIGPTAGQSTTTYETLETLLIAISPLYVEAMTREVSKRFEGYTSGDIADRATTSEEQAAEKGGEVWQ